MGKVCSEFRKRDRGRIGERRKQMTKRQKRTEAEITNESECKEVQTEMKRSTRRKVATGLIRKTGKKDRKNMKERKNLHDVVLWSLLRLHQRMKCPRRKTNLADTDGILADTNRTLQRPLTDTNRH